MKETLIQFINEYFDQNPLSKLCMITTNDSLATTLTDVSSLRHHHLEKLDKVVECEGEPSLQNALELAENKLQYVYV